jgi:hypothetical protein
MKSILIVVAMLLNSQQDLYIIQKPSFGSVPECAYFVQLYSQLIISKARIEYPGHELNNIYCVPKESLDQLYQQAQI